MPFKNLFKKIKAVVSSKPDQVFCQEIKLVMVGDAMAGKTTIITMFENGNEITNYRATAFKSCLAPITTANGRKVKVYIIQ